MKNIILILACLVSSSLFAQKFDKMLQDEIEKSAIFVVEEYFSLANFIGDTQKPIEHRQGNYRRSFLALFTDRKDNTICYNDLIPEFDDAKGFHSPETYIDNATSFYYQDGFKMNYKNLQIGSIRPHPSQEDHYVISVFLTKEVRGLYMKDSQLSQKFHDLTFFIVFKENQNYVSDFRIGAMEKYKKEQLTTAEQTKIEGLIRHKIELFFSYINYIRNKEGNDIEAKIKECMSLFTDTAAYIYFDGRIGSQTKHLQVQDYLKRLNKRRIYDVVATNINISSFDVTCTCYTASASCHITSYLLYERSDNKPIYDDKTKQRQHINVGIKILKGITYVEGEKIEFWNPLLDYVLFSK